MDAFKLLKCNKKPVGSKIIFWSIPTASFAVHSDCLHECNQIPLKGGRYYSGYKWERFLNQNLVPCPKILHRYAGICSQRHEV